jgi:hypothetical protein
MEGDLTLGAAANSPNAWLEARVIATPKNVMNVVRILFVIARSPILRSH